MKILLFARARDVAGRYAVDLDFPADGTVRDLRRMLAETYPALKPLLERSAIAVAGDYADESRTIPPDAEVAVVPPVSGG